MPGMSTEEAYTLCTWKLRESREELADLCTSQGIDCTITNGIKSDKRAGEMLAEMLLLRRFFGKNVTLCHTKEGAPYIKEVPMHISITHSHDIVCIAFSQHSPIGIDIEFNSEKTVKVRNKFLNKEELSLFPETDMLKNKQAWCSKEAIYKAAKAKGIDLKEDIRIDKDLTAGIFIHNGTEKRYKLRHHPHIDGYMITVAIPID